ncbi:hypothetical protein AAIH54_34465, partial [Pseudomonas aeruginosa]|uniref:hypothetical protein n=1 Tax=Pseudomonas aeruginosa TaxID=287 RepID=UPI0031B6A370
MLQRFGQAEMALLVAFAQIETVRVVALHVGRKLGHFGPGLAGFFFCPRPQLATDVQAARPGLGIV